MAAKYTAAQDFGEFKAGDPVTIAQAGEDAEQLLAAGMIRLTDEPKPPMQSGPDSPTFDGSGAGTPVLEQSVTADPKLTTVVGKNNTVTATYR